MSNVDDFIQANERYAAAFTKGDLPKQPGKKVAVVVCMDARLDPAKFLGLEEGDAHIIRNAGGRAADAIRSLVISQQLTGTREIAVIHHTDCGMLAFTEEELHQKLHDELHVHAEIEFLPFTDLEQSVRDDVETIRTSPLLIPGLPVQGYVYDVHSGQLHEVN
ncbi:MAG TPA: carbonic anhydrase [Thermomicrobiales bacterium]|jgi:carbonic anhydrase